MTYRNVRHRGQFLMVIAGSSDMYNCRRHQQSLDLWDLSLGCEDRVPRGAGIIADPQKDEQWEKAL